MNPNDKSKITQKGKTTEHLKPIEDKVNMEIYSDATMRDKIYTKLKMQRLKRMVYNCR